MFLASDTRMAKRHTQTLIDVFCRPLYLKTVGKARFQNLISVMSFIFSLYLIVYLDQSCLGEHTPIGVVKSQAQHSKVGNFHTLLTYYLETGRQHPMFSWKYKASQTMWWFSHMNWFGAQRMSDYRS